MPSHSRHDDPAHDRLRRLLDAHRAIAADLTLDAMLARIVRAACTLVGAGGGALAVYGDGRRVERIVHHGLDDETLERLATTAEHRLHEDGQSAGGAVDLLDEPIRVRGAAYGHLYLVADPNSSNEHDDADLLTALASFAGCAIDNACLYEDAQRSKDWLHASGEIARALLGDADADALMEVVSRALHVAEADYAALILPTPDGRLRVTVTVGLGAATFQGLVFEPDGSQLGRAIVTGRSLLSTDLAAIADDDYDDEFGYGPAMVAPLVDARGVRGGVVLVRTGDRPPFGARDLDLVTTFADQVALALQLNDARVDARSLHVLEDRHEVSRALHDSVIQRLFATGMGLQGIAERDLPVELAERLRRHVGDLDETIEQIRARVFATRTADRAGDEPGDRFVRMPHDTRMART